MIESADSSARQRIDPFFLDGPAGPVFAVYHRPEGAHQGDILYLPPFAEELNRSRRVCALLGGALAARGFGLLILDPFGCGDSAGDFVDGRWETWLGDAEAAIDWLSKDGQKPLCVLGLRLGGVLAMQAAAAASRPIDRVILWAPVPKGDIMVTQFLRTRIAAQMTSGSGESDDTPKETTKSLREILTAGTAIEVAGYELAPDLVASIDQLSLAPLGETIGTPIDWLELVSDSERPLAPVAKRIVETWQKAGVDVRAQTVVGESFWTMLETTTAPHLIDATVSLVAEGRP